MRILCALSVALLPFIHIARSSADNSSFKIGVILPLSGQSANFGAISQRGIQLALEQLPAQDKGRVSVIIEDDGLINSRSVSAAHKLIDIDKVDALVTWSSSTALAVVGLAESHKLPHISIASDPEVARGKRYSFTYWALAEDEAKELYDYLTSAGIKRIAIVSVVHNGALAIRDQFVKLAHEDSKIEIVTDDEVVSGILDFRSMLRRIKSKGQIDGFIPVFFPGQLAPIVKQLREVGMTAPLFGFETFEDTGEIKAAGGLFTGAIYSTGADPQPQFTEAYLKRFPGESHYTASQTYDAIQLLAKGSRGAKDGDHVAQFLRSLKNYETASGRVSATGDNRFKLPTELRTIDSSGMIKPFTRSAASKHE
jgi:branched-chain amino acid transport system substrate-binding protein